MDKEDLIEDVEDTEELSIEMENLEEESELNLNDSIKDALLGEGKKKTESEEEDEEDEEVESEEVEDEEEVEESKDKKSKMKESIDLIVAKEANLTEEFKSNIQTLFEAALSEAVVAEKERLAEQYQEDLMEEAATVRSELIDKIDGYLGYVVESFIEENSEVVNAKLRTEIAEDFMGKLKDLFVESYIEVPESKTDLVEELAVKVEELTEELNETKASAETLAEGVIKMTRNKILSEASQGLTVTQVEKLQNLTEEIEFGSKEIFSSKVKTIKESVFGVKSVDEDVEEDLTEETETIVEGTSKIEEKPARVSDEMAKYIAALSK
jgi:hypothetical protein